MVQKIVGWLKSHARSILQGVVVLLIALALVIACVGCSSFSGADHTSAQFGLNNQSVSIGDGNGCSSISL